MYSDRLRRGITVVTDTLGGTGRGRGSESFPSFPVSRVDPEVVDHARLSRLQMSLSHFSLVRKTTTLHAAQGARVPGHPALHTAQSARVLGCQHEAQCAQAPLLP